MNPERQKKIEQRVAAAEALKAEVRDAYRQDVGGGPPPESTEADREALRMLAAAWGEEGGHIRSRMTGGQSWGSLAQVALDDFPPELSPATRVHVSGAGDAYHRFRDCWALAAGKDMAQEGGKSIHTVSGMKLEVAEQQTGFQGRKLRPCLTCIPWPGL